MTKDGRARTWTQVEIPHVDLDALASFADTMPTSVQREAVLAGEIDDDAFASITKLRSTSSVVDVAPLSNFDRRVTTMSFFIENSIRQARRTFHSGIVSSRLIAAAFTHPLYDLKSRTFSLTDLPEQPVRTRPNARKRPAAEPRRLPSLVRTTPSSFEYFEAYAAKGLDVGTGTLHALREWLASVDEAIPSMIASRITSFLTTRTTPAARGSTEYRRLISALLAHGTTFERPFRDEAVALLIQSPTPDLWTELPAEHVATALGRVARGRIPRARSWLSDGDGDRFDALAAHQPELLGQLLLDDVQVRRRWHAHVVAAGLPNGDEFVDVLDRMYPTSSKVRVAIELATRTTMDILPLLLPMLAAIDFSESGRNRRGRQLSSLYEMHSIPKRNGGHRTIHAPHTALKLVQRTLLDTLFSRTSTAPSAHGFVRERSILTNARAHERSSVVVNVDIVNFFGSTPYSAIMRACRTALGVAASGRAVAVLAELCSYDRALPTGAPTSPAVANLVMTSVDTALARAAASRGLTYTRYADDLTFSGGDGAVEILPFVQRVLEQAGYQLDPKKTNVYRRGRRQIVTGLVVNERATASRSYRRRLRAAVHNYSVTGSATWHGRMVDARSLSGHLGFLAETRPSEAARLRRRLGRAIGAPPPETDEA